MRRLVGASVVLALFAACSGKAASSGSGGAAPGRGSGTGSTPTAGTVTVYPDTGEGDGWLIVELPGVEPVAKLGVDSTGEFHLDLPSGHVPADGGLRRRLSVRGATGGGQGGAIQGSHRHLPHRVRSSRTLG